VFQADAAHTNFGKYTLFSCYGSTANANTSPIAFAILFGNEDKAGWEAFFEFAKEQHPCLDHSSKTFITDQAKGLVESVKKVLPAAGHFHCSYHRRKNIEKYCKGGKKAYSGSWLYERRIGRMNFTNHTSVLEALLHRANNICGARRVSDDARTCAIDETGTLDLTGLNL
jgi:hypothetical protein